MTNNLQNRFREFVENETMVDVRLCDEFLPFILSEVEQAKKESYEEGKEYVHKQNDAIKALWHKIDKKKVKQDLITELLSEAPKDRDDAEWYMINTVIQGDCLELMKDIPDKSIDMVLTSPPYDNLREYKGNLSWDFEGIAKELFRVVKDGGVVVWVVGDATIKGSETCTSFKQALYFKEIGFNLHDTMIYAKQNPVPYHHNRYNPQFEFMFIFSKGTPKTFNPIQENTKGYKTGKYRYPNGELKKANTPIINKTKMLNNIWFYVVGGKGNNHPASFPEKLAEDHILSWSNEGDTILDPFAGSGTTGVACKNTGRNYILMEKEQEYVDIINNRLDICQK